MPKPAGNARTAQSQRCITYTKVLALLPYNNAIIKCYKTALLIICLKTMARVSGIIGLSRTRGNIIRAVKQGSWLTSAIYVSGTRVCHGRYHDGAIYVGRVRGKSYIFLLRCSRYH